MVELTSDDGFQIWSDTFDGETSGIFDFQQSVAGSVTREIFDSGELARTDISRPATFDAYDTFLRGQFLLAKRDYQSLQQADALLAETIRLDPEFGPAYLKRGITQLLLADYRPATKREIHDFALTLARQGAQRDIGIRQSIQLIHAFVNHQRGNWADASASFDAALGAAVAHPSVHHWYSRYLGDLGNLEGALQHAATARAMEPDSQVLNSRLAISYLWADDMENADRFFAVANALGTGVPDHHLAYALFQLRVSRNDLARQSVLTAFQLAQRPVTWVDPVIDSIGDPDNLDARAAALVALDAAADQRSLLPYVSITVYTLLGEVDRAMEIALQAAASDGAIYELEIVFVDEFQAFREHPKFFDLLESLGVMRQWSNMGCRWANDNLVC